MVGGSNGDGAWRGLVTIVQLIDPRPYMFESTVYGRLIYTVCSFCMSDRLLTQANPNPRLLPHPICVGREKLQRVPMRRHQAFALAPVSPGWRSTQETTVGKHV